MLRPRIFNDTLFDDFFTFPFYDDKATRKAEKKLYGRRIANLMRTDIKEKKDSYELIIDLPGFKKDDIHAELENGYLTVSASNERSEAEEKNSGNYLRRERYTGSCQRSFYVGEDLTVEDIKGEFRHGVLKLYIPKKEAQPIVEESNHISIEG
jgi:HSP20 family protein